MSDVQEGQTPPLPAKEKEEEEEEEEEENEKTQTEPTTTTTSLEGKPVPDPRPILNLLFERHFGKENLEKDYVWRYDGFFSQFHIYPVNVKLKEGTCVNFHSLRVAAYKQSGITIAPDLRLYGLDTVVRFNLYLKDPDDQTVEKTNEN